MLRVLRFFNFWELLPIVLLLTTNPSSYPLADLAQQLVLLHSLQPLPIHVAFHEPDRILPQNHVNLQTIVDLQIPVEYQALVMTPRRSSRARTTQPPPTAMQHTNSSSSTGSLPRAERSTRSNNKNNSPQRSLTQRSQSLEDGDVAVKNDLPLTRQRQLSRNDDRNDELLQPTGDGDEDDGEEEEITRCICGQQDYPGLPLTSREADAHATAKPGVKDESALHSSANASDALSEEAGSLFIQCDACKVWQHGGCVGIMDEATTPDEYFCEECKKDLHRIVTGING